MATNFTFLKAEWPEIFAVAVKAESLANTDSGTACYHAGKTLEMAISWIYKFDETLTRPYDNQLSSKIFEPTFKDNTPPAVFTKMIFVKNIGNKAVHTQKEISAADAVQTVRELFHILYWMARSYTTKDVTQFDGLEFVEENVPGRQKTVSVNTYNQLVAVYKADKERKAEEEEKQKQAALIEPSIDAELERLRKQVAAAKKKNEQFPDSIIIPRRKLASTLSIAFKRSRLDDRKRCNRRTRSRRNAKQSRHRICRLCFVGADGRPLWLSKQENKRRYSGRKTSGKALRGLPRNKIRPPSRDLLHKWL